MRLAPKPTRLLEPTPDFHSNPKVSFPLASASTSLQPLLGAAKPSPFGHGAETVVNTEGFYTNT